MARSVQLRHKKWTLGKRIGDPSGFGQVFEAVADDGGPGVVKMIPKQPGADRELLFEDLAGVPNVVPIIDRGETKTSLVIAMPRADRSLRAELESAGGQLAVEQSVPIMVDIAKALAAIHGRVVHRDLKPENVLLLDGNWCLADFGIARYAEASTSPATWKAAFSAPYAAPERWRFEHATEATDIYSLGVLGFELLSGSLPFAGPGFEEYRGQHLTQTAPALAGVPPALGSLIAECLFKPPEARPTASNLIMRLDRVLAPSSPGAGRLQAANQQVEAASAEEHARALAAMTESKRRDALLEAAKQSLEAISGQLRQAIAENAPAATPVGKSIFDDWAMRLGPATIGMDPVKPVDPRVWGQWKPKMDVVAHAAIGVSIPADRHGYKGRAHSLFFCDAQEEGVYRWFETAFMVGAFLAAQTDWNPIAIKPGEDSAVALAPTTGAWQVAWPFTPIDQGGEGEFIERWLDWFGQAALGQLVRPSTMPERPAEGTWRR